MTNEQKLSNLFGFTIIIYGTIVVYLATKMDNDKEKNTRINRVRMQPPTLEIIDDQRHPNGRYV